MLPQTKSSKYSTSSDTRIIGNYWRRIFWLLLAITYGNPTHLFASPQQVDQKKSTAKTVLQETEIGLDELVGVVVDSEGEPLEDVLVDAWSWHPGNETRTDKKGQFRLKMGDVSTKIEVRFMKEGYSPHYIVQQQLGVDHFSVTLGQKSYIEGVVRDPKGKPVPNVEIRCSCDLRNHHAVSFFV